MEATVSEPCVPGNSKSISTNRSRPVTGNTARSRKARSTAALDAEVLLRLNEHFQARASPNEKRTNAGPLIPLLRLPGGSRLTLVSERIPACCRRGIRPNPAQEIRA